MSEFIGESTIIVKADTRAFSFQVKRAAVEAEKIPVSVTVVASMKGFRADLIQKVGVSSKGVTASILVRPNMKGFRAQLIRDVEAATKGIAANVPVAGAVTRAPAARAASGSSGGASRAASAEKAVSQAVNAGVFARKKINAEIGVQEKRILRLEREEAALAAAEKAVTAAIREQNAALLSQAIALRAVSSAAVAKTKGTIGREEERLAAPGIRAAEAKAAAEAETKAVQTATAEQIKSIQAREAAETALRQSQRDRSARNIADAEANVRAALKEADADQKRARVAQRRDIGNVQAEALDRNREVIRLEQQIANVRRQASAVEAAGVGTSNAVAGAQKEAAAAKRASAAASKLLETATNNATVAQNREIAALVRGTAALEANKAATLGTVRAEAARSVQQSSVVRAVAAQSLQMIGLRGAALSADLAFLGAAASVIAFAASLKVAANFEQDLNVLRVTANATADEMKLVAARAKELGADVTLPSVGAADAAQAMVELSKAGLDVQDSMEGARGVLQLATAAGIENAEATELAANALNAFGLAGDQAVHVADVLTNAANDAQGSIVDIGTALQQSASVARQSGLSLEQTVAALTLFARNGLRGSDAGTSFRTALIRLINPTKKAAGVIAELGLNLRTSTGAIDITVFDQFAEATKNMTAAQRDQNLAIIFGQDAIRGAGILAREGADAFEAQVDSLNEAGAAAELASARMVGLSGSAENLKNQVTTLGISFGQGLTPFVKGFVDVVASAISPINDFVEIINNVEQRAKDLAKKFPQFKFGPVDTAENDRQFIEIIKKVDDIAKKIAPAFISPAGAAAVAIDSVVDRFTRLEGKSGDVAVAVRDIVEEMNKTGTSEFGLNTAVNNLDQLAKKLDQGDGAAQKLAQSVRTVRDQLKNTAAVPPFRFPSVELPPELKTGVPGKVAAESMLAAFDRALPGEKIYGITFDAFSNVGRGVSDAVAAGVAATKTAMDALAAAAQAAIAEGVKRINADATREIGRAQEKALDIEIAGGTPEQQIRNKQREFRAQQKIIDVNTDKLGKDAIDDRRTAKARQAAIISEIEAIENEQKQESDKAKADAKKRADEATDAFFNSLNPAIDASDRRIVRAQGTETLKDDRAALIARRSLLRDQIALIQENVGDTQEARDEIADKRKEIEQLNNDIKANKDAIDEKERELSDAIFERKQGRLERRQSIAEEMGDITGAIAAITRRIKGYNEQIRAFKGERAALQKLLDERDDLRADRERLRDDRLDQNTALAQSIFDLTGNKNPLLRAINAQIADTRKEISAAKKAGRSTVALQTELNNFLTQRKEILKTAEKEADSQKGTTAFDLMAEFNARFGEIAGNLVGPDQPFAGGSQFTDSIVNKAIANFKGPPHRPIDLRLRGEQSTAQKQINVTQELIGAIRENTDAQRGGGNRTTVTRDAFFTPTNPGWGAAKKAREVRDG